MLKKIFLGLLLFTSQIGISQNHLTINNIEADIDSNFSLVISLSNTEDISGFQFDIEIDPEAYDLTENHLLNTDRTEDHVLEVSKISDSRVRVLVFSATNKVIQQGEGSIITLNFSSKNEPSSYTVSFSNVIISNEEMDELSYTTTNGTIKILGPKFKLLTTDLNLGNIRLGDNAQTTIRIFNEGNKDLEILSSSLKEPLSTSVNFPIIISGGSTYSLPITLDTNIRQEISQTISFTTNDEHPQRSLQETEFRATIFAVNELILGSGTGEINNPISIPLSVNNMESFIGLQLDVIIPDGMTYVANSISLKDRHKDHIVSGSIINNNVLRIIAYSPTNSSFEGNSGEILTFSINPQNQSGNYSIQIVNPILSGVNNGNILSDYQNGNLYVNASNLSFSEPIVDFGAIPINSENTKEIRISNTGSANLLVQEVIFDDDYVSTNITTPLEISPNQEVVKNVILKTDSLGHISKTIVFRHNGVSETDTLVLKGEVYSPNYLMLKDKDAIRGTENNLELSLINNDSVKALQFDLEFPEGFNVLEDKVTTAERAKDFSLAISKINDTTYRIVMYSANDAFLLKGEEAIINVPVIPQNTLDSGNYKLNFTNRIISGPDNNDIATEALQEGEIVISDKGNLLVNIGPEEVNSLGAQWRLLGSDSWMDSGVEMSNLNIGQYTIEFKQLTDWVKPDNEVVSIDKDVQTILDVSYEKEVLSVNSYDQLKFSLFPNPVKDNLKIKIEEKILKFEIYDLAGKKLKQDKNVDQINISDLAKGMYFIKIYTDNRVGTKPFIKN